MWRLALAVGVAAALLLYVALHGAHLARLVAPIDVGQIVDAVKSNPQLYAEALEYLARANVTISVPPRASPTQITIELNASEVVAGEPVAVRGILTSGGKPLARQAVAIYLNGSLAAVALTNSRGEYSAVVEASVYEPSVVVRAVFHPLPGAAYMPSNASAVLRVLYNETALYLRAPSSVTWGEDIVVEVAQSPPLGRPIVVSLSNGTGVVFRAVANGSIVVIPTRGLAPGVYRVYASAPGVGPYAPASAWVNVSVVALEPTLFVDVPRIAVAGAALGLGVETRPPLSYRVYIGGVLVNGSVPLTVPTGYVNLTVETAPSPPYGSAEATAVVLVVNPFQLAPLAAVPFLVLAVRRALRGEPPVVEEIEAALPRRPVTSIEHEAVALLAAAFQKLGDRSGVRFSRKMTFREYARIVEGHSADPACLWHVVWLAERAFFSPYPPTSSEVSSAWACVERL